MKVVVSILVLALVAFGIARTQFGPTSAAPAAAEVLLQSEAPEAGACAQNALVAGLDRQDAISMACYTQYQCLSDQQIYNSLSSCQASCLGGSTRCGLWARCCDGRCVHY